jgi:aminoglycoside phosphotransferase family enzyme/predicted kinase
VTESLDEATLRTTLREPACYARHTAANGPITLLETHISLVALAGELVFKVKKPRHYAFLDFSTLERRRAVCNDEVQLNRRLCPQVYLGIAHLRREPSGSLSFSAIGDAQRADDLEVAVVMRRLPQERMLDRLLHEHAVTRPEIESLARVVAKFHATADRGEETRRLGDPDRLEELAEANFRELAGMATPGPLSKPLLDALHDAQRRDFARIRDAMRSRAQRGFVVDGHGDLHARNVCMTDPPAPYDCLEFDAAFRCADTATDLAFLAMDLRHRGAPELSRALVDAYVEASGDRELPNLLPTLVAYRAIVRAKVTALAAADEGIRPEDRLRATDSSVRHLLLAAMASLEAAGPIWIATCGPPGSGKSTLAATLANACGTAIVSTDLVRKHLAGKQPTERLPASCYTPEFSVRTYRRTFDDAAAATRDGAASVLLDGNFPTRELRSEARRAALASGARFVLLHVDVPASTGLARVTARLADPTRASDADPTVHDALRARFVEPNADEELQIVRVDGDAPPLVVASAAMARLLGR